MNFDIDQTRAPAFGRRLAALFYDLVLLFGVLMIATTAVVIPYYLLTGAPFPHDEGFHRLGLRLYLIAVICLYFLFFGCAAARRSVCVPGVFDSYVKMAPA